MTCCVHYGILQVTGHHQQFEAQFEAQYWNFIFDFERDIFVLKDMFWYYVHIWHMTIYVYTNMYLTVPADSSVVIVASKQLASQPHPLPVSMLHGSEVQHRNIHFAGSTVRMTRIAFSNVFATALGWEAQFGLGRLLGWEATLQFFAFCCWISAIVAFQGSRAWQTRVKKGLPQLMMRPGWFCHICSLSDQARNISNQFLFIFQAIVERWMICF